MTIAFASNPNKRFAASQIYQTPFVPAPTTDPYFEYTTLLLPGTGSDGQTNNSFLDSGTGNSGGPFTVSRQGNPTQGTFSPFSQTGWGNYFDGSGDYLYIDPASALNLQSGAFTIEFWVFRNSGGALQTFLSNYQSSTAGYGIYVNASNKLTTNLSGDAPDITGTTDVPINQWFHVALSGTPSSSIKLFLNGVQESSTYTGATSLDSTRRTAIGAFWYFLDNNLYDPLPGYISNLRILKGTALYTANFTPPTAPLTAISGTSLLTCQSNRFIDNSTNNFTITRNGDTRVVAFSPFNPTASWSAATHGGSGYFDGSGDYLSIANNSAFDFGAGEFTLELWWYPTTLSANQNVMSKWWTGGQQWVLQWRSAGYFRFAYNSSNLIDFTGAPSTPIANAWNHIAIVRSVNSLYLYLNGLRNATVGTISATLTATTDPFVVGQFGNSAIEWFTGYASGLVVVKGGALYTGATLTVPTTPPTTTVSSGTVSALLNFTNAGIYDATSKNDLETVGDAQISNTTAKWGSTSIKFDGTGDYLTNNNASNPLLAFGTGDFTIEGWFYSNDASSATQRGMFQTSDTIGGLKTSYTTGVVMNHGSTGEISVNIGGTTYSTSGASITTGAWFYFAITRSSGNVNVYINGVSRASGSGNTSNLTGTYISVGGYYNTSFLFNGYIQDLRITRYARTITASPTAPFPTL